MKKILGIAGLILVVLLFWYVDLGNPEEKKIMSKETKRELNEAVNKFKTEVVPAFKDAWDNDSNINKIKEDVGNTLNADTVGSKIRKGVDYTKENVIKPTKEYVEDIYDEVTE